MAAATFRSGVARILVAALAVIGVVSVADGYFVTGVMLALAASAAWRN